MKPRCLPLRSGSKMLLTALLLMMIIVVMGGCRQKCVPGADIYPDCRGGLPPEEHELVVWNIGEDEDVFKDQFADFSRIHKTVEISYKSFPDEAEYKKALLKALALGEGPDVFAMPYTWLEENKALVAPAPRDKVDPAVYRELFHPAVSDVLIRPEGEQEAVYGVTLAVDTLALYYNLDALRQEVNKFSPAKTWPELIADATALARRDPQSGELIRSGIAMGLGDSIRYAPDIMSLLFVQYGARVFDEAMEKSILAEKQTATPSQSTSTPGSDAFALYTGFADEENMHQSWTKQLAATENLELEAFLRGDVAMIFGYSDLIEQLQAIAAEIEGDTIDIESSVRVSAVPQLVVDKDYQWDDSANLARFSAYFVAKQSAHPESAWELLLYLADEDPAAKYMELSGKPPARKSLSERVVSDDGASREAKIFAEQAGIARALVIGDPNDYALIMRQSADAVATEDRSPASALKRAQKQLQCVLERIQGDATKVGCTELEG